MREWICSGCGEVDVWWLWASGCAEAGVREVKFERLYGVRLSEKMG